MTQGLTIYKAITGDTLFSLQVHQKRPGCPTCDNTFISLSGYTHPFIFTRVASSNDITTFRIYDSNDTLIETLDNSLITIINAGAIDYIICNFDSLGIDPNLPCDHYYYQLIFGTETYYSEIFRTIDKDIELINEDIAVNGDFNTDLSGWTVDGATWDSGGGGRASIGALGDSIAQETLGTGMVKITVNVLSTFLTGMEFNYGVWSKEIIPGDNVFYIPSGTTFTILNNDDVDFNSLTVVSVTIFQIERVECYNLIVAKNSCNKNNIPYPDSAYADVFIIDSELYEPEYVREDENEQDGNKDKSTTFMRIDKRWVLSGSKPLYEPLVDELQKLPANDCIYIFNDVWKKSFIAFEDTLDIETRSTWFDTNKCNAMVDLIIDENLVINNACCEEIEDLECCVSFDYELDEESTNIWRVTIIAPFCAGMRYSYLKIDEDGVIVLEISFPLTAIINTSLDTTETYSVKGAKFGCPDVIYELNLS